VKRLTTDAIEAGRLILEEQQKHAAAIKPTHADTSHENDFMSQPDRWNGARIDLKAALDAAHERDNQQNKKVR
jgi:hypothetical protein